MHFRGSAVFAGLKNAFVPIDLDLVMYQQQKPLINRIKMHELNNRLEKSRIESHAFVWSFQRI